MKSFITLLLCLVLTASSMAGEHKLPFDVTSNLVNAGLQIKQTPNPAAQQWGPRTFSASNEVIIPHPQIEQDGFAKKFYVLVFGAEWCGHCKALVPLIAEARQKGITLYKFDADIHPTIFKSMNIRSFPTVIYMDGGQEQYRFVGVKSRQTYLRKIKQISPQSLPKRPMQTTPRPHRFGAIDPESGIDIPEVKKPQKKRDYKLG